jgi:hypothetical protein
MLCIMACDGDKKARSPGRARRKPLKPLRREGRAYPAACGDYARMFFYFYIRGCGCVWRARLSLRPLWAKEFVQLGQIMPRERSSVALWFETALRASSP